MFTPKRLFLSLALFCLCLNSCGGDTAQFSETVPTQSIPIIQRLNPTILSRGDTLSVFGFGFSLIPQENVISIGNTAIAAASYALADTGNEGEIEVLTVTIPNDTPLEESSVFVIVNGEISNSNLTITIQP